MKTRKNRSCERLKQSWSNIPGIMKGNINKIIEALSSGVIGNEEVE